MSKIEVNQISSQCGSTLTIGQSGDTVTLAAGATQSGFGRTGTVDWDTTAKTTGFTAVSGNGYFVNTTSGAITVTLPATPSAGDIVSLADYTNTWQTNNVTVARNGSLIGGIAADALLSTEGQSVTFIYVDGTEGWKNVQDSTSNVTGNPNLIATGGTITTCGNYKIHTFTSPGTFTVTAVSQTAANNNVSYLVVAGGGSSPGVPGSGNAVAGGGGGGFRENKGPADCYTASPLEGSADITVTATSYPITVGAGGSGGPASGPPWRGTPGSNSIFSTITSAGGGTGGHDPCAAGGRLGDTGGSGGGTGGGSNNASCRAAGNTPPVTPPQGNPGGGSPSGPPDTGAGGGGGALSPGADAAGHGGNGGNGATTSISGSTTAYGGGGGGGAGLPLNTAGTGGAGGGGAGGTQNVGGTAGTANRGGAGGGGGLSSGGAGAAGGSGIVIIRYKYQ